MTSSVKIECVFYAPSSFPQQCIGPVRCLLQEELQGEDVRRLWLWVHAGIYDDVTSACVTVAEEIGGVSVGALQHGLVRFAVRGIGSLDCLAGALVTNGAGSDVGQNEQFWAANKHSERLLAMWEADHVLGNPICDARLVSFHR